MNLRYWVRSLECKKTSSKSDETFMSLLNTYLHEKKIESNDVESAWKNLNAYALWYLPIYPI